MRSSKDTHFKAQTPCRALVVFHTVRCGDYWCKLNDVYACALLKVSNIQFCVFPFHPCLFVLVFESFFWIRSKYIFFEVCNFILSNRIIIHGEGGDMEFFCQSSTRYLSSERSAFPHFGSHAVTREIIAALAVICAQNH